MLLHMRILMDMKTAGIPEVITVEAIIVAGAQITRFKLGIQLPIQLRLIRLVFTLCT